MTSKIVGFYRSRPKYSIFLSFLIAALISTDLSAQSGQQAELIKQYVRQAKEQPDQITFTENNLSILMKGKKDYVLLRAIILTALQNYPQSISLTELLIWQYIRQKDFNSALLQLAALHRRGAESDDQLIEFADICVNNDDFATAENACRLVIEKGASVEYKRAAEEKLLHIELEEMRKTGSTAAMARKVESEHLAFLKNHGENLTTARTIVDLADLETVYLHEITQAIPLLKKVISLPGLDPRWQGNCKMQLGDCLLATGDVWQAALYYGQVQKAFKQEPIGQEAMFRSSKIYYYTGNFKLARSQLDVLKTATSELIANDALKLSLLIQENVPNDSLGQPLAVFARSELLIFQNKFSDAQRMLDSIGTRYPHHTLGSEIRMAEYRMAMAQHRYEDARKFLKEVCDRYAFGIWGDEALYYLASLNEIHLRNPQEASALYEQLIVKYPGSYFVNASRKRFRVLRGDLTTE